jgi:hypothetical protein
MKLKGRVQQATSEAGLAVSDMATIYGCTGLFDLCSDSDLMTLSFEGQQQLLDWIGWEPTSVCLIKKNFITFVRAESENGVASAGYIQDACGDSNGVEWGTCDFTINDFGRLRRHSPTRDLTKSALRMCETQPRYRLDGSPITSDVEYEMRLVTEVMIQDWKRMIINGNKNTPGHFDGLQRLIKTGYTNSEGFRCQAMDSTVINWNGNSMAGGNGVTWNGLAVANTYAFVDVVIAAIRRVKSRIDLAPALASQGISVGDIIFLAPENVILALLDAFTCWSVCPGVQYREANLNTFEARNFRNNLNGGMFGKGRIFVDGFEIPLMAYGWGLLNESTGFADAYLLTGQIGSVKTISGQFNDMRAAMKNYPDLAGEMQYTDGGRLLTWTEQEKVCVYREVEAQPRLLMWAPWAQVRFQNVNSAQLGGFVSPDPFSQYFPTTSFSAFTMGANDASL